MWILPIPAYLLHLPGSVSSFISRLESTRRFGASRGTVGPMTHTPLDLLCHLRMPFTHPKIAECTIRMKFFTLQCQRWSLRY